MKRFLQQQLLGAIAACKSSNSSGSCSSRATVTAVLGNEAADADSIVSALCLAYLRHSSQQQQQLQLQCEETTTAAAVSAVSMPAVLYVPVACVVRSRLHLRRDVQLLLSTVGVDLEDIICMDDIDFAGLMENSNLNMVLVDQNTVPACLSDCASKADEILDHHQDAGALPWVTGANRDIAFDTASARALVGSACTLIAERHLPVVGSIGSMSEEVARLLLGVIALDTFDMDPIVNKGTARDEQAMDALQLLTPSHSRRDLFLMLKEAKIDLLFWRGLSAADAIALDYKMFLSGSNYRIGISSVLLPVEEFLTKSDVYTSVLDIFKNENLSLFVAMTLVSTGGETRREVLCVSRTEAAAEQLSAYLTGPLCAPAGLELRPPAAFGPGGGEFVATIFAQGNVGYSRKQMAKYFIELDKHVTVI
jgi:exopolyphosphatase